MVKKRLLWSLSLATLVCSVGFAVDWDEGVDGDLADDELAPTPIALTNGSNLITGTIGGDAGNSPPEDFFDAFSFVVGPGESVDAIVLVDYVPAGNNSTSGFNVFSPDANTFIDATNLEVSAIGDNLLDNLPLGSLTPLGPGSYTIGVREGTPGQTYQLDVQFTAAVGACCTDGPMMESECIEVTEDDCRLAGPDGGLFLGSGTTCVDVLDCVPLYVEYESISATKTRGGVAINWVTAIEIDTVGFRILRDDGGRAKSARIVANFIPAVGFGTKGASYEFIDATRRSVEGSRYVLESIDIYGKVQRSRWFTVELRDGSRGKAGLPVFRGPRRNVEETITHR